MPTSKISFPAILDALLDESKPFSPRYLHRFSDLNEENQKQLEDVWPRVPDWRRLALLEDLQELSESDTVTYFEVICRLALHDPTPAVRIIAIQILRDYELPDLAEPLMKMAETDADAEVRAAAAGALSDYVYLGELDEIDLEMLDQVENCLLRITRGADAPLVRRRALESLGYSEREEVNELIQKAYDARNKDWMVSALFAMGRSANEHWNPYVLRMLESSINAIQVEAASAAGELGIKDAVPHLMDMVKDEDQNLRSTAIWALSQIGGAGPRQLIEELLENADEDEEEFLEEALENLAFTEDVEFFSMIDLEKGDFELLEEDDPEPEEPPEKPRPASGGKKKGRSH